MPDSAPKPPYRSNEQKAGFDDWLEDRERRLCQRLPSFPRKLRERQLLLPWCSDPARPEWANCGVQEALSRWPAALQRLVLGHFADTLRLLAADLYRSNLVAIRDPGCDLPTLGFDVLRRLDGVVVVTCPRDRDCLSDKGLRAPQFRIASVLFVCLAEKPL